MAKPRICAGIITRNESKWLPGCLNSLGWVDEIVVGDAFSDDGTFEIAKQYTDKAFQHSWDSYSKQRNRVLEHVSGDWLLWIDADERATPDLRDEVLAAISSAGDVSAFEVPTINILLGRRMKHGGWSPEPHIRLVRVDRFEGWEGDIHEHPEVRGKIGRLENGLVHFSHRDLASMLEKTIRYSAVEAKWRHEAGYPRVTLWTFIRAMTRQFGFRGILKAGFFDGTEGGIEVIYQTFSSFITYARLWELQREESLLETYERLDAELTSANTEAK